MAKKTRTSKENSTIIVAIIAAIATLITAIIGLAMPFAERMASEKNPIATPSATETPFLTPPSTVTLTQSLPPIILEDDFDINLGIFEGETDKSFARVMDGAYRVGVVMPNIVTWRTYNGIEVDDFYVKVDIIMPLSTKLYSCGIVFQQNADGRYFFGINNDKGYEFINVIDVDGESTDITMVDWLSNIAINTRGINKLEIIAEQDAFELFVNGVKLKAVTDTTHDKGDLGFYVSTYGGGQEVIIEFDNLLIEER